MALAADSVVTLSGPSGSKTYDSAEKIFELSRFRAIGLMIYNHVEFSEIPLEVLARKFRDRVSDEFPNLTDVWPEFQRFLIREASDFEGSFAQFDALLRGEFERLRIITWNAIATSFAKDGESTLPNPEDVLVQEIERSVRTAEGDRLPGFLDDVTLEEFSETFGPRTQSLLKDTLIPWMQRLTSQSISDHWRSKVTELAFALVRSRMKSQAYTGLVFAGFGRDELFPSLHGIEMDGVYFGELRIVREQQIDIDRLGETAAIVPFAQTDMPERFIYGIDQEFENKLRNIAVDLADQVMEQMPDTFDAEQRHAMREAAVNRFMNSISRQKERSAQELRSIVNHLSKKELGEVAYSLVELTSRKRRYSSAMETVGGPIDVAILTRNEGFIWTRRKHYFDAQLNPGYFERVKMKVVRANGGET